MARKRMIDPNIWESEDFSRLSNLAKLVFIGLFSNADDEGRGRAKPIYIKSIIFPYDEQLRVTDIEKSLDEIAANMSITFYCHNGTEYYSLNNWTVWQRIDKPTDSKFPPFDERSTISRGTLQEDSPNTPRGLAEDSRLREDKGKEDKEKRKEDKGKGTPALKKFIKPTLEEVRLYCAERNNGIDPEYFFDKNEANGWVTGKNNTPIKDWKAVVRTWERNAKKWEEEQNANASSGNNHTTEPSKDEMCGIKNALDSFDGEIE